MRQLDLVSARRPTRELDLHSLSNPITAADEQIDGVVVVIRVAQGSQSRGEVLPLEPSSRIPDIQVFIELDRQPGLQDWRDTVGCH